MRTTSVSKEIKKVTRNLSQQFSWAESWIVGVLSILDDFFLNSQIRVQSGTDPEFPRKQIRSHLVGTFLTCKHPKEQLRDIKVGNSIPMGRLLFEEAEKREGFVRKKLRKTQFLTPFLLLIWAFSKELVLGKITFQRQTRLLPTIRTVHTIILLRCVRFSGEVGRAQIL